MDPILHVIHYLFKKKNKAIFDESVDSFFDSGISFPQFIAIIFDIEKIPKVNPNPKTIFHSETNNYLALQYLFQNNIEIAKFNPNYKSSRDRYNLLALILSKQCFHVNLKDTIDKCNIITQSLDISFHTKKDIVNKNCILALLNVLTEGKVPIKNDTDSFDQLMVKSFEIAKVPLVINETSLYMQNQFIFIIQLEIIFDFFSDKINQLKEISIIKEKKKINKSNGNLLNTESKSESNILKISTEQINNDINLISQETRGNIVESNEVIDQKTKTRKSKILINYNDDDSIKDQEKTEKYFLKAINMIGSGINLHFDNFFQAIENCNLAKLVKHLLKKQDDQIFIENIINNKNVSNSAKNNSIIKYLCQIDPRFEVLLLDFEDPGFSESSIIIFYQNLLDSFFIKKTKSELFERCYTILYGRFGPSDKYYKKYKENEILLNWSTYLSLINFVENGKVVLEEKLLISKSTEIIEKTKIPIILDEVFFKERLYFYGFNLVYYQLQFIFDELDRSISRYAELFLITLRNLKQIKLPSIDQLLKSVRSKNISLALQIKRNKENTIKKRSQKDDNNAISCPNKSIQLPLESPLTFTDRKKESSKPSQNQNETQESIKFDDSKTYWNHDDSSIICDNGIMFDQQGHDSLSSGFRSNKYWNTIYDSYSKQVKWKKSIDTSTLQKPCFELTKTKNKKSSLYKFFYFDEKSQKWRNNDDAINQFAKDNNIDLKENFKIPLILLFNSYEQEMITLCSKIILNQYPNLDESENEIFIYGLMGLPLSMMNFNFDSNPDLMEIMPLFLLLHVPTSKQNIPNLKKILFQIYSFLYTICDIRIAIPNNKYYSDQINMNNAIKEINDRFTFFDKDQQNSSDSDDEYNEDKFGKISLEKIDNFEEDTAEKVDKFEKADDDKRDRLLDLFDTTFAKKSLEAIILFNHKDIRYTEKIVKPKENQMPNSCFINIDDPFTYRHFLDTLNRLICKSKNIGNFQNIKNSFQFLQLFRMSTFYLYFSRSEEDLLKKIEHRYNEIKERYNGKLNEFHLISSLQKEILKTFPLLDREYSHICNNILNELSKKINQENIENFQSELEISSENNLKYLEQLIKHKVYWTDEQIDNLKNGHYDFLKQEFFNIIKYFSAPEIIPNVYIDNQNILSAQFEKDSEKIESFLSEFKKKLELKNKEVPNEMEQETNYTIRERENEREIKVRVEINGDIEDLIPSDY